MKKLIALFLVVFATMSLTSCYQVKPDPGKESVLVYKPYIFGHGGVDKTPISTGATWCVWTTDEKTFDITPVTITEEFNNMIPSDNTPVSFSAYLKVQLISGRTPELYEKFGENWYVHSLQARFRTMVRDKACAYKMFDLASKREISAKLETEIFDDISKFTTKLGIPVIIHSVTIGAITPPTEVLNETKNTAAQNQSILTQDARANAELSRKQAEINKAIADKAYMKEMGMSVNEYLHLRQLEIEKEKVELIKDNKNATVIFGQSVPLSYPVK